MLIDEIFHILLTTIKSKLKTTIQQFLFLLLENYRIIVCVVSSIDYWLVSFFFVIVVGSFTFFIQSFHTTSIKLNYTVLFLFLISGSPVDLIVLKLYFISFNRWLGDAKVFGSSHWNHFRHLWLFFFSFLHLNCQIRSSDRRCFKIESKPFDEVNLSFYQSNFTGWPKPIEKSVVLIHSYVLNISIVPMENDTFS